MLIASLFFAVYYIDTTYLYGVEDTIYCHNTKKHIFPHFKLNHAVTY